ncbi:hypothetical protein ACFFX0_26230 [Citricoccus parietis]|uniref:Uncharacterized protein n=1 Tax=Citricoccus parietis TaxID=592307 RepID=A0ABV5G6D2_9MICC
MRPAAGTGPPERWWPSACRGGEDGHDGHDRSWEAAGRTDPHPARGRPPGGAGRIARRAGIGGPPGGGGGGVHGRRGAGRRGPADLPR